MKNEYRCACCNNLKNESNQKWRNYQGRGSSMAICRSCDKKIDSSKYKTISGFKNNQQQG